VPGMLSTEAPRGYRVLLAAPALYVLAAWTLVRIDDFARRLAALPERMVLRSAALGLLAAVPILDFDLYFFHTYTSPLYHYFQGERIAEMARTLRRQGPGWTGYVLSDSFDANHECLRFLARCWGLQLRNLASLSDALPVRGVDRGALFMMTRGTLPAAEAMSAWYPEGRLETRYEPVPRDSPLDDWLGRPREAPAPSNAFFAVSRAMADAKRGARAQFRSSRSSDGATIASRIDPVPRLAGSADLPEPADAIRSARWTAVVVADTEGPHRFVLWDNLETHLRIDGVELAASRPGGAFVDLAAGAHLLELDAEVGANPRMSVRWQPPGRGNVPLPDEVVFQAPGAGLLAEVTARGNRHRRYDAYPFQGFFAEMPAPEQIAWTGKLLVPNAGKRLRVDANAHVELLLDGDLWHENQTVSPGAHDFDLRLTGIPTRPIVRLEWRDPNGNLEPVAAAAFAVPPSPRSGP
jgi:hypothetical protein